MTLPWALHGNIGYQIRCRQLLALCAEMMVNDNGGRERSGDGIESGAGHRHIELVTLPTNAGLYYHRARVVTLRARGL